MAWQRSVKVWSATAVHIVHVGSTPHQYDLSTAAASVGKRLALVNTNPAPTFRNLKDWICELSTSSMFIPTFVSKVELRSIGEHPRP